VVDVGGAVVLVVPGRIVVVVLLGGGSVVVVVVDGAVVVVDDGGLVVVVDDGGSVVVVVGLTVVVVVVAGDVVEPGAVVVVVAVGPPGWWGAVVVGGGICTNEISCGGNVATDSSGLILNAPFGERAVAASRAEFVAGRPMAAARPITLSGTVVVVVVESPDGTGVLLVCSIPVRPTPDAEDKPHTNKARKTTAAPRAPASWSRGRPRTHWIMVGCCRLLESQETFAQENPNGPRLASDASRSAIRGNSPHVGR
jgi:hypothetical protein